MTTLSSYGRDALSIDDANALLDLERTPDEDCVATIWKQATPGTSYARCLLPARHLPGQCLSVRQDDLHWNHEADELVMPRQRGIAIWQFLGDNFRSKIAWGLQDLGVRTLMELDDSYLVAPPSLKGTWHKTIEEAERPGNTGYSYEQHKLVVPTMDGLIVSTEWLKRQYAEYIDEDKIFVCPNTVDPVDWTDLEEKDPNVLRIVYSGSQSHLKDAPQVKKALKWAARQKGVEVWLQGVSPLWTFASQAPWVNGLHEYRRKLGSFDVGLAPLVGGIWANGKSDLKALEYTMAGVVPFVARETPYKPWWDTPFEVESSEAAWMERVKWIVSNRDALPELLNQARAYVLAERTTAGNIHLWREAINA